MKVYVVTSGSYSDYSISRIFSNKEKAEEYAEWLEDSNDVEEYDMDDVAEFKKYYKITVNARYYDNEKCDIKYHAYKTIDSWAVNGYTSIEDYHKYGDNYFDLCLHRAVEATNYNEEFYKSKYSKVIYDLIAIVKQKMIEGFDENQINELLNSQ